MKIEIIIDDITEKEIELIEDFLIDNRINYEANVIDKNTQDEEYYLGNKSEERYYNDRD